MAAISKEQFAEAINALGTCEDDVERRRLLTELQDNINPVFDENTSLTETNTQLTADNERIQAENMRLFLRVSEPPKPKEDPPPEPPKKREFKNLFNEKGRLSL